MIVAVEKYGKRKITTKDRLFIIDDDNMSYYPLPEDKAIKKELLDNQKKIRTSKNLNSFENLEQETIKQIIDRYRKDKQP